MRRAFTRRSAPPAMQLMVAVATTWGKNWARPTFARTLYKKETDAQLNDSITNGKGKKMPAYKGKLTDDQIKDLVGYIRDLAKKK